MNWFKKTLVFIFILIINTGCSDGDNGDVFLRIRAVLEPTNVIIENSDIPENFEYDVFYRTNPGNYPFSYVDHNGTQHPLPGEYGVLEIISDPGQEGGLFSTGENGEDRYIDLILLSTGAVIENNNYYTIATTLDYDE